MTNDLFQENISVPADKTPAPSDVLQQELLTVKEALQKAEKSRDEYRSKYLQFKAIFQKQTHAFYLYQHLTDQSKEELSGIFKGKNFEAFLACGVQPANIDALWEYARQAALAGSLEDDELLNQIIAYFVNLYNITNDAPILGFQNVSVGDAFDVDWHIRTQNSKPAGTISKILLTGLTNAFTGEVIKKAVIEITD